MRSASARARSSPCTTAASAATWRRSARWRTTTACCSSRTRRSASARRATAARSATIGALGTLSFHETKNVSCGEGGALLINDERLVERAEILQEKGTDRRRFARGEVDQYTWVDVGSSVLMSDISAALLAGQLARVAEINAARMAIWDAYHAGFEALERAGLVRRPVVPEGAQHNAHLYRLQVADRATRDGLIATLAGAGISAYFHYVPLHSAPAGLRHGRVHGPLDVTEDAAARLVRMPLWVGLGEEDVARVVAEVRRALGALGLTGVGVRRQAGEQAGGELLVAQPRVDDAQALVADEVGCVGRRGAVGVQAQRAAARRDGELRRRPACPCRRS